MSLEGLQTPRRALVVLQAASGHARAQRASARFSSAAAAAAAADTAAAAPLAGEASTAAAAPPGMQCATDAQSAPQAAAGTGPVAGGEAPAARPLPPPPPRNTKIRCWGCRDVADPLARSSRCPQRSLVVQTVGPDPQRWSECGAASVHMLRSCAGCMALACHRSGAKIARSVRQPQECASVWPSSLLPAHG